MKKALIINPFGIGDIIFSFPLAEALVNQSGMRVDYVCNERTDSIVRLNPSISKYYVFNRDALRSTFKRSWIRGAREVITLLSLIRKEKYDVCFDLSMGREYAFWMMCLGIRKRIGFNFKNRGLFLTHKLNIEAYDGRPVRQYMMDLYHFWSHKLYSDIKYPTLNISELSQKREDAKNKKYIVIAPGGGATWGENAHYKQWPPEYFSELLMRLIAVNKYQIVIMGSEEERELCQKVIKSGSAEEFHSRVRLCVGEDAARLISIFSRTTLFIGNDGGLLHLADLLGVRIVGFYGPVDEKVYGPLLEDNRNTVITANVSCRPCYQNFKFPPCSHDKQCLTGIRPDLAWSAIQKSLDM